eukprot:4291-Eustigmatos_ZCMA.PRE.1
MPGERFADNPAIPSQANVNQTVREFEETQRRLKRRIVQAWNSLLDGEICRLTTLHIQHPTTTPEL